MKDEDSYSKLENENSYLRHQIIDLRSYVETAHLREEEATAREINVRRKLIEALDMIANLSHSNDRLRRLLTKAQKELAALKESSKKPLNDPRS